MGQKILFTASTYSHIVNFHLPYLKKFQEEGCMLHAACGGSAMDIPYVEEVIDIPIEKTIWSPQNFGAAAILRRKILREKYDLVIAHTTLAAFITRLALRGMRKRPLLADMVHGYLFDDKTPYLKRKTLLAAERWMAPVTDLLLTMNWWDYELARKYRLGQKVVHVPGVGVDFSRFDNVPLDARQTLRNRLGILENAFVLIYAAEFSARKSQMTLIYAMEQLPEKVVLVLAGDGALRNKCETLSRRLGLERRVVFPGHVKDVEAWYAMADAAVSASRSEGLPFNVMEAMYAGLPVVASNVKGHSDLITDGETGLLYPYGDVEACAGQIWRLMDSERFRQRLGGNAVAAVEPYRLESVLPQVWVQYAGLTADGVYV